MKKLREEFLALHKQTKMSIIPIECAHSAPGVLGQPNDEGELSGGLDLQNRGAIRLEDYIPDRDKPLTFICVNIHMFQDSNGRGAFNYNDIPRLRQIIEWVSGRFWLNFPPNYNPIYTPPHNPLPQKIDSRIRFILNRIEFYQDDTLCASRNPNVLLNAVRQRDASMMNQLNFIINHPTPGIGGLGRAPYPSTNLNFDQYVWLTINRDGTTGLPNPYLPGNNLNNDFFLSQHWCHELGHFFGLCHVYPNSGPAAGGNCANCDETHDFYLYDIYGHSPNQVCPVPTGVPNNNIMSVQGGSAPEAISTLQIAKMHYALEHLSSGRYARGCCCGKCVAFGAQITRHQSQGSPLTLEYGDTLANKSFAWDGKLFTCPVDGVYNFSVSYQKDSLVDGGTPNDVYVKLWADYDNIGTAWSEKADARTRGIFNKPQYGRRDSVCYTTNIKLKKGTVVKTEVGSHDNAKRHLVDLNFSGHLLCSDCC